MSRSGKTGGGRGTNQYKIRGQAKRRSKAAAPSAPIQSFRCGQCVWLDGGPRGAWCLHQ